MCKVVVDGHIVERDDKVLFPDGTFDAVVCERAFRTFLAKEQAAAEFVRVLPPGGSA